MIPSIYSLILRTRRLALVTLVVFTGSLGCSLPTDVIAQFNDSKRIHASVESADIGNSTTAPSLPAPRLNRSDYPVVGGVSSRAIVWIAAQMHLFFGALVLAVPIFVLVIEFIGYKTGDDRYDDMAHEFLKITLTAYAITALFGGTLLFVLILLYPDFMTYMMRVFRGQILFYPALFILESVLLYVYYYGWNALRYGSRKRLHLALGLLLNLAGTTILVVANSWSTFMMAPSGVDSVGAVTGSVWEVMNGPLWHPLNVHRFIANIAFGGAIVGAYSAFKFLNARTMAEKAHYDWMGYTSNFIAIVSFLPLPFAGYWLTAEIYAYSQTMGLQLMGGILAWVFVVQAVLICTILLAGNYYLWAGMGRTEGGKRYRWLRKYIATVLVLGFLVWITPHNVIYTPEESARLGGSYHPVLGPLGLMPAKNTAVFLMLLFTFLSFQVYRRADKIITVPWRRQGNLLLVVIYSVAILNIVFAGVYYGYFTNTVYKVASSVIQVASTLIVIVSAATIDSLMFKGAERLPVSWGRVSGRSQYALFVLPVAFTWLMALMGYVRSAVRTDWHVYKIMKDASPDNYVPALQYIGNMVSLVTVLFLAFLLLIFWIANLSTVRQVPPRTMDGHTEGRRAA